MMGANAAMKALMAEGIAAQLGGGAAAFRLLSRLTRDESRYPSLLHGWPRRIRDAFEVDENREYFDDADWYWDDDYEPSYVVRSRRLRFRGWKELLRPTDRRTEVVPVGEPVVGRPRVNGAVIHFDFDDKLKAVGLGPFVGVRMWSGDGVELADLPLGGCVVAEDDEVFLADVKILLGG